MTTAHDSRSRRPPPRDFEVNLSNPPTRTGPRRAFIPLFADDTILQVTFWPDGAADPVTFEAEFYRFFTGPDEGDSMTVRYEPAAPGHAVSSELAKPGGTEKQPLLVLHYKTPRGENSKQTFFLKRGEPYFWEDSQVVVLSSIDERRSYVLRADGYPLAVRPEVEPHAVDA